MEKRARRKSEEEKSKEKEEMKILDVIEGLYTLLYLEFIFACGCILLGRFVSFEVCFYLLFGLITTLNDIGALCIELKMKKENNNVRNNKVER